MRRDPGIRNMGRVGLQAPGLARMMAPLREADPGRAPRRFSAGHGGQDLPENATRRQISTGASIWRAGSWLLARANRAHGPEFCSLRGPERRAARGRQDADRVPACRVQGVSRSLVLWEPPLDPDSLSAACGRIVVDSWGVYGDRRTRPADGQKTDQNPHAARLEREKPECDPDGVAGAGGSWPHLPMAPVGIPCARRLLQNSATRFGYPPIREPLTPAARMWYFYA